MDFHVKLSDLERSAHVPVEDQVEEHDVTPPVPDAIGEDERDRQAFLRIAAPF